MLVKYNAFHRQRTARFFQRTAGFLIAWRRLPAFSSMFISYSHRLVTQVVSKQRTAQKYISFCWDASVGFGGNGFFVINFFNQL
jgi:hypothetical protein